MRLPSRWLQVITLRKNLKRPMPVILVLFPVAAMLLAGNFHPVFGRPAADSDESSISSQAKADSSRPFPQLYLDAGHTVEYLGMFPADTRYRASSKLTRFADRNGVPPPGELRQEPVPPNTLHSSEYAVANYAPPRHAMSSPHVESPFRGFFNNIATLAYGHQKVLQSPENVATDSQARVIVVDRRIPAVHVIDPQHQSSFRILGGEGRRIGLPGDVAVDADDNIYVADFLQDLVIVYDRYGRFLRSLGTTHDEKLFQQLSGIAIDRRRGYLYAADGPRHLIYMFDLQGAVLKRVGQSAEDHKTGQLKIRGNTGPHEFNDPTRIVVGEHEVLVLDTEGTRIRILDLNCNLIGGFVVQHAAQDHASAVGIDTEGRIYVLYSGTAEIRVYNREGKVLTTFGGSGIRAGEFNEPGGLWIDQANRLYISDTSNSRVQLFQLKSETNGVEENASRLQTASP